MGKHAREESPGTPLIWIVPKGMKTEHAIQFVELAREHGTLPMDPLGDLYIPEGEFVEHEKRHGRL